MQKALGRRYLGSAHFARKIGRDGGAGRQVAIGPRGRRPRQQGALKAADLRQPERAVARFVAEFRLLLDETADTPLQVCRRLEWFREHALERYTPVIRSGNAFREKYAQLADAQRRHEDSPEGRMGHNW
jgi:hypothetical protein